VHELIDVRILDRLSLTFELFEVHKKIKNDPSENFVDFLKWGQQLLTDFNEVDLYMVDPQKLYEYLNETRALTVWNLGESPLTDKEKSYLKFYNSLADYYKEFNELLLKKGIAYQGMAYRILANNIEETTKNIKWKKVVFAGFNALTRSEEIIIKHLEHEGIAEVLWDADSYYIDDRKQEAGKFLRQHFKKNKKDEIKWIENNYYESKKNINIIGAPKNVAQVKLLGSILSELKEKNEDISDTAVVLGDESLLIPTLHSIPADINAFNITMGLPLQYTSLYDLLVTLFSLFENAVSFSEIKNSDQPLYYHKLVDKLLANYYVQSLFRSQIPDSSANLSNIPLKAFYTSSDLQELVKSEKAGNIIDTLFVDAFPKVDELLDMVNRLLQEIRDLHIGKGEESKGNDETATSNADIELEYLYSFSVLFKRISALIDEYQSIKDIQSFNVVFQLLSRQISIPFYGEPLKGLQLMGMLETRTLDFKNLIVLSVNENILPAAKHLNSYVPHEIRKEFNLPTYKDKDSIFAYHFYRLLQRSENVYLVYNTENDNLGSGEQSRFIKQMIAELPKVNPDISINESIVHVPYKKIDDHPISVEKTDEVMARLTRKAETGFSPSVFNSYIQCSLKFYFEQIMGLWKKDEVEEEIDAKTFGKVMHDVLEVLYEHYVNRKLNTKDLKDMLEVGEVILREFFSKYYKASDINYGKNFLKVKTADIMLNDFIRSEINDIDKNRSEIIIKGLEEWVQTDISIDSPNEDGTTLKVKLKGKIDRIDSHNNIIRIIDYKSGKAEQRDLKIEDLEDLLEETRYSQAFQLLMYAYLYRRSSNNLVREINAGVFALKDAKKGLKRVEYINNTAIDKDVEDDFGAILKHLLEQIFDKNIPFEQTPDTTRCVYCDFANICNRWTPRKTI